MSFTGNYLRYLPDPPPAPTPQILYATATGDPGSPLVFPMNRVRWLTPPRDIAAMVTDAGGDRFEARLFHFGTDPRPMAAELYMLQSGEYELALLTQPVDRSLARHTLKVEGPRTRIHLELPSQVLCTLRVARIDPASAP